MALRLVLYLKHKWYSINVILIHTIRNLQHIWMFLIESWTIKKIQLDFELWKLEILRCRIGLGLWTFPPTVKTLSSVNLPLSTSASSKISIFKAVGSLNCWLFLGDSFHSLINRNTHHVLLESRLCDFKYKMCFFVLTFIDHL